MRIEGYNSIEGRYGADAASGASPERPSAQAGRLADPGAASAAAAQVDLSPEARSKAARGTDDKTLKRLGLKECQTCKNRTYKDGSDDPGVSFKAATHVAPEQAAAAVAGHENEHVFREQAKAKIEGRKVVSQNVQIHTSVCPECGRIYVSGGETTTVTRAADKPATADAPRSVDIRA